MRSIVWEDRRKQSKEDVDVEVIHIWRGGNIQYNDRAGDEGERSSTAGGIKRAR